MAKSQNVELLLNILKEPVPFHKVPCLELIHVCLKCPLLIFALYINTLLHLWMWVYGIARYEQSCKKVATINNEPMLIFKS